MRHRVYSVKAALLLIHLVPLLVVSGGCTVGGKLPDRQSIPAEARRVLVISVDGMRPDVLLRADAPNIRRMVQSGSFTFYAESTDMASTLPTHTSMLTGVRPDVHGITLNDDQPGKGGRQVLSVPTLFDLARRNGRTTAMVAAKSKFSIIAKPGPQSLDWAIYPTNELGFDGKPIKTFSDAQIAQEAVAMIRNHRPQVLFVHFGGLDAVGHRQGWGSAAQVAQLSEIDRGMGKILHELERRGLRQRTLVLLTSDHGGAAKGHGGLDARSRYVPFVAAGPGVRQNFDLTLQPKLAVRVEDVFATALEWLEIDRPAGIYGRPVWAIYQNLPAGAPTTAPTTAPVVPSTTPAAQM